MAPAPKAKKTKRNQPVVFDETLSTTMLLPAAPVAAAPATARTRTNPAKFGLVAIWILAALAAGVGVGRLIKDSAQPVMFDAGTPIATADLTVTPVLDGTAIAQPVYTDEPALTVQSSAAVMQAQAGNITATVSAAGYQPATNMTVLQPGFALYNRVQGTTGTAAVR